jgi:DMSO/TMAO reductase YedYZ molybdopterin-dependent catalytic subunit
VPEVDLATWRFTIGGLVDSALVLDHAQFMGLPQVCVLSDIHCVTRWSRLDNLWQGVSTSTIKELVSVASQANFAFVRSAGGYTTNLALEDFFQPDVLLAVRHDDQPLTPDHGHPVRLVVPRLYFWKSAKWVTGIEFVASDRPGFWESYGYHNHGDPWREQRYAT